MSAITFYADDTEFAGATGSHGNFAPDHSVFDNPPGAFLDLAINSNPDDDDPRLFKVGDTYDLDWGGFRGGCTFEDAMVVRSDMAPGDGGIIVFESTNQSGALTQIIWTPDFSLEGCYRDNDNPSAEPQLHTVDQNSSYDHMFMCFAGSARISPAMGLVAGDELRVGYRIDTLDAGAGPMRRCISHPARSAISPPAPQPAAPRPDPLADGRADVRPIRGAGARDISRLRGQHLPVTLRARRMGAAAAGSSHRVRRGGAMRNPALWRHDPENHAADAKPARHRHPRRAAGPELCRGADAVEPANRPAIRPAIRRASPPPVSPRPKIPGQLSVS